MSEIIWLCGSQTQHVEQIYLTFADNDRTTVARYSAILYPDKTLAHFWTDAQKPELRRIVEHKMITVEDSASGKKWQSIPD